MLQTDDVTHSVNICNPTTAHRRRRPWQRLALVAATTVALAAGPAAVAGAEQIPGGAFCLGDSVMLGAGPGYAEALVSCGLTDAVVSRQMGEAAGIVGSYLAVGYEPGRVVIHLGTNGYVAAGQVDAVLAQLTAVPRIVIMTVQLNGQREWEGPVNDELRAVPLRWANVVIGDWKAVSDGHPEYFAADGFHLTAEGAAAYSATIDAVL